MSHVHEDMKGHSRLQNNRILGMMLAHSWRTSLLREKYQLLTRSSSEET